MSPLYAVLHAIEDRGGPVSLRQLGLELGIEPDALQGMIDFWVQKGRLRLQGASEGALCAVGGCGGCPASGPEACPILMHMPRRYEVTRTP